MAGVFKRLSEIFPDFDPMDLRAKLLHYLKMTDLLPENAKSFESIKLTHSMEQTICEMIFDELIKDDANTKKTPSKQQNLATAAAPENQPIDGEKFALNSHSSYDEHDQPPLKKHKEQVSSVLTPPKERDSKNPETTAPETSEVQQDIIFTNSIDFTFLTPSKDKEVGDDLYLDLHLAVRSGNFENVEKLILNGHDLNCTDRFGNTPLHDACGFGHLKIVSYLISKGADFQRRGERGRTPLHTACSFGYFPVVQYLLSLEGIDVNLKDTSDGATPLHLAAGFNRLTIAKELISRGCDVNAKDFKGRKPINAALEGGYKDLANLFEI